MANTLHSSPVGQMKQLHLFLSCQLLLKFLEYVIAIITLLNFYEIWKFCIGPAQTEEMIQMLTHDGWQEMANAYMAFGQVR